MDSSSPDLPQQILDEIAKTGSIDSLAYSERVKQEHQKVIGAIKSLESLGSLVKAEGRNVKTWHCTDEGTQIAKNGSHEARLLKYLPKEGDSVANVKKNFPNADIALGACLKKKWVQKKGDQIVPIVSDVEDTVQKEIKLILDGQASSLTAKQLTEYKKRKLIKDKDVTVFNVTKDVDFTTQITKQETLLTKEMLESGDWKNIDFKPYNFNSKGKAESRPGYLHPLMLLRSEFRQIFLEMGFTEMPTNSFVESAFWNFDALFQPQQHPARDCHDTFYISQPATALEVPKEYMEKVKKVHSEGGYGSSGYRYSWSAEEAYKNLLRTHTTAVSARMLHKIAKDGFKAAKLFSIDRVFRNETLDATHLAEFHQIEGVVADYNLSIKHLIGIVKEFFKRIGIEKLRFKATYNPYTEPSMEVFSFHEGLGKWVELGNSGIFRPEMLRPMGLPEGVSVLGFGLSLERPAMIMSGSSNIRELVGPRVKLEHVYANPLCSVEK